MTPTKEQRAELRRLHAAFESGRPIGVVTDEFIIFAEAACTNLLPLLDALAAAEAERDRRIVSWLRSRRCGVANDAWDITINELADAIERGEHDTLGETHD